MIKHNFKPQRLPNYSTVFFFSCGPLFARCFFSELLKYSSVQSVELVQAKQYPVFKW